MSKKERQKFITELIAAESIRSQSEIVDHLEKHGFAVTQASVSRDLDELRIDKQSGRYQIRIGSPASYPFGKVNLAVAGDALVVARCAPGTASALAVMLDSAGFAEIVGTIAGDDTVFIAVDGVAQQRKLFRKLQKEIVDGI